jgi:transcription elongation factor
VYYTICYNDDFADVGGKKTMGRTLVYIRLIDAFIDENEDYIHSFIYKNNQIHSRNNCLCLTDDDNNIEFEIPLSNIRGIKYKGELKK